MHSFIVSLCQTFWLVLATEIVEISGSRNKLYEKVLMDRRHYDNCAHGLLYSRKLCLWRVYCFFTLSVRVSFRNVLFP